MYSAYLYLFGFYFLGIIYPLSSAFVILYADDFIEYLATCRHPIYSNQIYSSLF